ncbi:MAG: sterol desaturase family protein [Chitinophagaceae bacterium]|nr:sterol desaturase family protein [Chitinophagaceae bacterium]
MPSSTTWYGLLLIITLRYLMIAGLAYVIWYWFLRRRLTYKKIQQGFPKPNDYRREVLYSLLSIIIFTAFTSLILLTPFRQFTRYYKDISQHGWWYFWLAFPVMFFIHDTYFYWMHRLMHHPKLFRHMHVLHHKSTNPSPWAAFAFQPVEAVVEVGIVLVLVMIMPIHFWHLFAFFFVMMVYNVYGHLGWELYPKNFSRHWLGRWINTSINHNQHHQYFKGNYGLYFLWWDRWMHTIRTDYETQFEKVKGRLHEEKSFLHVAK